MKKSNRQATRQMGVEALEARIAPAYVGVFTGTAPNKTFTLTAGAAGENAVLFMSNATTLQIDYQDATPDTNFDLTGVSSIVIEGSATGADNVQVLTNNGGVATPARSFLFKGNGSTGLPDLFILQGTTLDSATVNFGATSDSGSTVVTGTNPGTYNYANTLGGQGIINFSSLTAKTPVGADSYVLTGTILETAAGASVHHRLIVQSTPSVTFDFGANDVAATSDTLTVASWGSLDASSLTVKTGSGDDSITFSAAIDSLPATLTTLSLDGGTGSDTFAFTTDSNPTLTNASFAFQKGASNYSINLNSSFEVANLTGGAGANNFTVTEWTGSGSLTGGASNDTVTASNDVATFTLSNTSFARTGFGTFTLATIEAANLTGGSGANALNLSGWTGTGSFDGAGGTADSVVLQAGADSVTVTGANAANSAGFNFTNIESIDGSTGANSLTNSTALAFAAATNSVAGITFSNFGAVDTASLTLTSGPDVFTVPATGPITFNGVSYTGLTSVDALGGTDQIVNQTGLTFATQDNSVAGITFTGIEAVDSPAISLTSGSDVFTATGSTFTMGGIDFTGVSSIDALGGNDFLTNNTGSAYAAATNSAGGLSFSGFENVSTASLTLTTGADDFTLAANGTSTFLGVNYSGLQSIDALGGADILRVIDDSLVVLTPTSIQIGAGGPFAHAGFETFELTADTLEFAGTDAETVTWSPSATTPHDGSLLIENGPLSSTVNYHLDVPAIPASGPLFLNHLFTLNLETGAGADVYTLDQDGAGVLQLAGTTGTAAHSASLTEIDTLNLDFGINDVAPDAAIIDQLTISSLQLAGLNSLSVRTGAGDDLLELSSDLTSLKLGLSGDTPNGIFTFDGGLGTDTIEATAGSPLSLELSDTQLAYGPNDPLNHLNTEVFELNADSVNYTGTMTNTAVWTPSATADDTGSVAVSSSASLTTIDYVGRIGFFTVLSLDLNTPVGTDDFVLDTNLGLGTLNGTVGTNTIDEHSHSAVFKSVAQVTLNFDLNDGVTATPDFLTVKRVNVSGMASLTVNTGAGDDQLELESTVTAPFPLAFIYHAGLGQDTLKVTSTNINLGLTTLSLGAGNPLTFDNVELFDLTGTNVNFTGNGSGTATWEPDSDADDAGTVSLPGGGLLTYSGSIGFFSLGTVVLNSPAGADTLTLGHNGTAGTLTGTMGAHSHSARFSDVTNLDLRLSVNDAANDIVDSLTIDKLTASGLETVKLTTGNGNDLLKLTSTADTFIHGAVKGVITWDSGAGALDTIEAAADVSMELTASSLLYQDNGGTNPLRFTVSFTGGNPEFAKLTGGDSANRLKTTGATIPTEYRGGLGDDLIDLSGGFSALGDFYGEGGSDRFIVQLGTARLINGAGTGAKLHGGEDMGNGDVDSIEASGNINFVLKDSYLTRIAPKTSKTAKIQMQNVIDGFEQAVFTGGSSGNLLDAGRFTGFAILAGEGGTDNLITGRTGGDLYGFHNPNATTSPVGTSARDNYFMAEGTEASMTTIYATTKAGNVISFRYDTSTAGVNYTLPSKVQTTAVTASRGGAPDLQVRLAAGKLGVLEGSQFNDTLTGNNVANYIIGLNGNDTLIAKGFDFLFGGAGADKLLGVTPFKYTNGSTPIPSPAGAALSYRNVTDPARFPAPSLAAIAEIIASAS